MTYLSESKTSSLLEKAKPLHETASPQNLGFSQTERKNISLEITLRGSRNVSSSEILHPYGIPCLQKTM